jgi:signal transduction histidine kinase
LTYTSTAPVGAKGEKVSDYPQVMIRLPHATQETLEALSDSGGRRRERPESAVASSRNSRSRVRAAASSCARTCDLSGQWDIERLSQVLSNLLGNALEHGAPQTPIRVELSGDTDAVTIQVTNYGRTIAADALRALFEPLRAAAGTESSAKRGPGLGLYIVDPIVAAHGGTVAATSADGEGTRFTVRLPRTA